MDGNGTHEREVDFGVWAEARLADARVSPWVNRRQRVRHRMQVRRLTAACVQNFQRRVRFEAQCRQRIG